MASERIRAGVLEMCRQRANRWAYRVRQVAKLFHASLWLSRFSVPDFMGMLGIAACLEQRFRADHAARTRMVRETVPCCREPERP